MFFLSQQVDVSAPLAYEMAVKEEAEIKLMQKASQITCDVFSKYLRDQIMEIIDAEKVILLLLFCGGKSP